MVDSRLDSDRRHRLVIQPNASLSRRQALAFMGWMCVVSFGIAGLWAWQGYWMILPFAGLEMAALAGGLYWSMRHNGYREVIEVGGERITIEAGHHAPERRWSYQRAWTQVRLLEGPYRNSPTRLMLGSHGQYCVLGQCLSNAERSAVAERLRGWTNETTALR